MFYDHLIPKPDTLRSSSTSRDILATRNEESESSSQGNSSQRVRTMCSHNIPFSLYMVST